MDHNPTAMPLASRKLSLVGFPGVIDEVLARRREGASFTPPSPPAPSRERGQTLVQRGVFSAEPPESVASPRSAPVENGPSAAPPPRAATGLRIFYDARQ